MTTPKMGTPGPHSTVIMGTRGHAQLAHEWGYHYLESGRKRIMYGGVGMHWTKMNTLIRTAVSETRFLSVLVQRWTSCKGSHSRYGER